MAAQGDRMSGANGCGGTLWNEERLVASWTAIPRRGVRSEAGRIPVSGHLHGQHTLSSPYGMLTLKVYSSTVVTTIVPSTTM